MNRRKFLGVGLSAAPVALLAQDTSSAAASSPVQVMADADRFERPCHIGGRSIVDGKVSSSDTGGNLFVIENRQKGQFGPPRHVHTEQDEWFYVITGEFVVEVGEQHYRLKPGDSVLAPRGIPHVWAQISSEPGRLLIAFQPAGQMEAFFRAIEELGGIPPGEQARKLFESHGMAIVGPSLVPG